jgi:hypothetical protein
VTRRGCSQCCSPSLGGSEPDSFSARRKPSAVIEPVTTLRPASCAALRRNPFFLALAIAKAKDENAVLKEYRSAAGRKRLTDLIGGKLKGGLRDQLETFVRLLGYWRDDASHGRDSGISEAEANMALLQLLRFAQFANAEWSELTA